MDLSGIIALPAIRTFEMSYKIHVAELKRRGQLSQARVFPRLKTLDIAHFSQCCPRKGNAFESSIGVETVTFVKPASTLIFRQNPQCDLGDPRGHENSFYLCQEQAAAAAAPTIGSNVDGI